ncbi:TPA: hypothetical protein ACGCBD_002734 [Pseudomonas aeruginosa]
MNKANECTCPSGDGSLVHPCPAHPAVEQAGGDERDFQAKGAQEVPSPVSKEYDRHLISLLRKGEALPGHQEEAADEIERLRDWNDHLNNTVLPNILNPNFLMLMKGGERLLDLCTKDGEFIGVSLNDMKDVFDWMVTHARIAPDQAALAQPSQSQYEASFEEWLANELEGEDGQPVPAAVCDITLARRAFNHWPKLEQPAKVGSVRFSAGVSSRLVVEAAQRLCEFESTPEKEAERIERLQAFREQLDPLNLTPHAEAFNEAPAEALRPEQAEAERPALWAVHAQGPDELYAAFSREDAEKHAAELNALPMPEGIAVGAVVVPSPWPEAEHWKYLAEQEQDHKNEIAGRLRQLERICEGLPQDAIDGGWTAQGIRGYAKRLEDQLKAALAQVEALRAELQSQRERNTELIFKLGSATNGWGRCEKERDAALARVAELERQQPVAWMHDQPNRVDVIHRDVKDLLQRVPGSSRGIHRPLDVSEHYTIPLYAAPVAQAQHSVPEISGIGRDAEHPRAVVLYLRNEPSEEDMRAIQNFLRAISADVLTQAQHSVPIAPQLKRALGLVVAALEADGDRPTSKYALSELKKVLAAAPGNSAQHSVPEGLALIPVRETEAMHDAVMALLYKGVARTDTQKLLDAYIAAAPGKEGA